ncbi:MAG TPA: cysteine desulfurase-like protein [Gemmatimonadaceae bacterium]|nr:cysteine desulfurase-like protein [Gemmatimonadaceae bacterium]
MTSTVVPSSATTEIIASIEEIRRQFPALSRVHHGQPVAYFDGPGGTQVPRSVADAMADYLFNHNANTHWLYPTSAETDALLLGARERFADFFNASAEEIAFGLNMTTLTFHLARGLGRELGPGDEIVVTELDHHGNVAPWRALEKERGVTIRVVRLNTADGRLDWRDLERQLNRKTRVLAIGAASNALGTITDVRAAAELAHAVGALVFVDAVHLAPHALIDVEHMNCDFLACSAYKFYGSHVGILYGKRDLLERVDVPRLDPAPNTAPERLETGTQNHEGIVGAAAAVDFLASLVRSTSTTSGDRASRRAALRAVFDGLHYRGEVLLSTLWNELEEIEAVTLYGPRPGTPRTPTLAFTVRGHTTDDVARALAKHGLFVSNGDFYAATVIERLGQSTEGVVRVGCSCYTTMEEVERLIRAMRHLSA